MKQTQGQYSIFDIYPPGHKRKPCEYSFKRYIGQQVKVYCSRGDTIGRIKEIDKYYTIVQTKAGEIVGTPTNTSPWEAK